MLFSWIPHVLDVLPFFKMDEGSRRFFLQNEFGIENGHCPARSFDLSMGQSINLSIELADKGDVLDFHIVFNPAEGHSDNYVDLNLHSNGMACIRDYSALFGDGIRYVLKDIMLLLRVHFSPLYGSDRWGRDQFKISEKSTESDAIQDIIEQMSTTLYDMVAGMTQLINNRLMNSYDQTSDSIHRDVMTRADGSLDDRMDDLRIANGFIRANLKLDSQIEDWWHFISKYNLICDNFIRIFNIQGISLEKVDNTMSFGKISYNSITERRELDMRDFELKSNFNDLELAELSRKQAEEMGSLSKFVAVMTIITTIIAAFQLFKEYCSIAETAIYTIICGTIVSFLLYLMYNGKSPRLFHAVPGKSRIRK